VQFVDPSGSVGIYTVKTYTSHHIVVTGVKNYPDAIQTNEDGITWLLHKRKKSNGGP
jgi:hypothetical protein